MLGSAYIKVAFGVVIVLTMAYGVFFYESDVTVISLEAPVVQRDSRYDELLSKDRLLPGEKGELKRLSYEHYMKLNLNSNLTFESWEKKYMIMHQFN
jgi:hypothetical protein